MYARRWLSASWYPASLSEAWAYGLQYAYAAGPAERRRLPALTLYLDPASPRIKTATAAEVVSAKVWFKEHNPFRLGLKKVPTDLSLTWNYQGTAIERLAAVR